MDNFSRSAFTILEIDLARWSAPTHKDGVSFSFDPIRDVFNILISGSPFNRIYI